MVVRILFILMSIPVLISTPKLILFSSMCYLDLRLRWLHVEV